MDIRQRGFFSRVNHRLFCLPRQGGQGDGDRDCASAESVGRRAF